MSSQHITTAPTNGVFPSYNEERLNTTCTIVWGTLSGSVTSAPASNNVLATSKRELRHAFSRGVVLVCGIPVGVVC